MSTRAPGSERALADLAVVRHVDAARRLGFVVNGELQPVLNGEVGELLIRVPKLSTGGLAYRGYTDEQATAKKLLSNVFRKGDQYFRSGDLLRRDEDGFYYFVDRIGDTFHYSHLDADSVTASGISASGVSVAQGAPRPAAR